MSLQTQNNFIKILVMSMPSLKFLTETSLQPALIKYPLHRHRMPAPQFLLSESITSCFGANCGKGKLSCLTYSVRFQ